MNLENWELLVVSGGMHRDPSESGGVISGRIFGHDSVPDGTTFVTSKILGYDFRDQCFVDASGNELRLKDPEPSYEQRFPNAKAKVEKAVVARRHMMTSAQYAERR